MAKKCNLTREIRSMGGKAIIPKKPPDVCPRCGLDVSARSWHSYLGHLGLHGLADNHFDGDLAACQKRLRNNGIARQDPFPGNHAHPKYIPIGGNDDPK